MKVVSSNAKKNATKDKLKISLVVSLIIGSIYIGFGIFIMYDIGDFNRNLEQYYWPDSEYYAYTGGREFKDFYSEEVNWTLFEERAMIYENWTDQYGLAREEWNCSTTHISMNFKHGMTSPFTNYSQYEKEVDDFITNGTSKFREIQYEIPFGDYGDSPIWTGAYLGALGFHYAVACREGNVHEANQVLIKMVKPIEGLHISTHVTGLDGNLVRFAAKDTEENRKRLLDFFYKMDEDGEYTIEREFGPEENRWPGQGEYEDWVYVDDTSRDQHFGLFFGYGIVYKLLDETEAPSGIDEDLKEEIMEQIANDGTDVLDCLEGANWHVISGEKYEGNGRGHNGASMFPRIPWASGGDFMASALTFGKMINEKKYGEFYKRTINQFLATSFHDAGNQAGAYFGNNLAFMNLFLAWFLADEDYRQTVRWHYNNDYYKHLKYHRNVMVNLGYFIINELELDDILADEKLTYILDDVTENMDSFARWKFPVRVWHIPRPDDYDEVIDEKNEMYYNIFSDESAHILKTLYGFIVDQFSMMHRSKFALGVKTMAPSNFVWQRSPFHISGHMPDDENYKGNKQMGGADFTLPYFMGRYYGFFSE